MKKPKGLSDKSLISKYGKANSVLFESIMKKAVTGNASQSKPVTKGNTKKK
jgi:hypothetical protein